MEPLSLISLSLDAALMRQQAIAYNIANQASPNFQSQRVNFEEQFVASGSELELENLQQPFYTQNSSPSSIDEEFALSLKNSLQYKALIKGLNYKLATMKLALHGNNQA